MFLKQSTAVTVKVGPFVDSTDGNTQETALTIAQADIRLSKNGGAFAQTNNVAGATHDANGWYGVPLDTTDTGTLGKLELSIHETGALAVWRTFMVVPANVWDSLFGADKLEVDVAQFGGTNLTAAAGRPEVSLGNVAHGGAAATVTALSIAVTNSAGTAVKFESTGSNGAGLHVVGNGGAEGLIVTGGATADGAVIQGGATGTNHGLTLVGVNAGSALRAIAGATGHGFEISGGATSGDGMRVTTTSGAEINADITGNLSGTVGSLGATAKTDVNAEVVDALNVDTYAEPGQGTPAATLSLVGKINYLFKAWRNKSDQTATLYRLYNDDTTTVDQKATVSDDATTFVKGEVATGP